MAKDHILYEKKEWSDEEPDTFSMSLQSEAGSDEIFIVMRGNATWLNVEQAKEVEFELARFIAFAERRNNGTST